MADPKLYVDAVEVARDWGVSKAHAYKMIRSMNKQIREQYPCAIVVSGRVSREYYEYCCLKGIGSDAGQGNMGKPL